MKRWSKSGSIPRHLQPSGFNVEIRMTITSLLLVGLLINLPGKRFGDTITLPSQACGCEHLTSEEAWGHVYCEQLPSEEV